LGYVYYADRTSYQRFSAELRQTAIATIQAVKTLLETDAKAVYSQRCDAVCTPNVCPKQRESRS